MKLSTSILAFGLFVTSIAQAVVPQIKLGTPSQVNPAFIELSNALLKFSAIPLSSEWGAGMEEMFNTRVGNDSQLGLKMSLESATVAYAEAYLELDQYFDRVMTEVSFSSVATYLKLHTEIASKVAKLTSFNSKVAAAQAECVQANRKIVQTLETKYPNQITSGSTSDSIRWSVERAKIKCGLELIRLSI